MNDQFVPAPVPQQEVRVRFHRELDGVVEDIVRLGAMVCELVPRGTEVLLGGELHEAQQLIEDDDAIDRLSISIEERCYSIMVLQSPMAGDLRRLITITKLVAELERSADLVVNVCKAARRMYGSPMSPKIRGVVAAMAKEAHKLLTLSIDAFVDENEALASALDDIDDQLDQLNRDMVEAIFDAQGEGAIDLQSAVQLALVARFYERIGDHAVNIGQRVIYMVTGGLPEHDGDLQGDGPDQSDTATNATTGNALPLGVVVFDEAGNEIFSNGATAELTSDRLHQALVQTTALEVAEEALGGRVAQKTLELYGNRRTHLTIRAVPVDAEVVGQAAVLVTIEDTTEVRAADLLRRDFVANVSHELKTPIGAIGVLAETLAEADDPEVAKRLAARLQSESYRLAATVDDLLTLARIESGEQNQRGDVSMTDVFAAVAARVGVESEEQGVTLEFLSEPSDLVLNGDRVQLVSGLGNLVDNAVKYSESGSTITVTASATQDDVTLTVEDRGVGIPEADLDRIFERFYRVDQGRSRDTGGTGLGLSIVRHVVLNHGGTIEVASTEGVGTTFVATLPGSRVQSAETSAGDTD